MSKKRSGGGEKGGAIGCKEENTKQIQLKTTTTPSIYHVLQEKKMR